MTAAEILRKLADIVDSKETGLPVSNMNVSVDTPTDTADIEDQAQVNVKSMVPPLQQKLELMKRIAGEEACEECGCLPCECDDSQDEMEIMKRNAGIAPVVVALADEDEPFES